MFTCRNRMDIHLKKMNFHRNRMDVYWNRMDVHWNRKNAHRNRRNVQWKGIDVHWNRIMDVFIGTEWIFTDTFWVCTGIEQNTYTVLYILKNSRFSQAENRHLAAIAFGQSKINNFFIFWVISPEFKSTSVKKYTYKGLVYFTIVLSQ